MAASSASNSSNFMDNLWSGVQSGLRVADTARIFAKHGLGVLRELNGAAVEERHVQIARRLRESFEELGATYIKLGQLIASAPGLFPRPYVEEMQKCLDSVAPLPFSQIQKVLHEEFGGREKHLFAEIDPKPIASASIAQVHGAKLKTGEDVVIKVQRPGIHKKLSADLNTLYVAAYVFEKLAPGAARASLTGIVSDFQKTIMEEVDFIREAGNIDEFRDFLQTIDEKRVVVPAVHREATTTRVLTMERFYGVPLTDLDSIRKLVKDPEDTLILALNTWFQSLLICGFFHADVHAGNLMVLNDGLVGFIDFGIVGRMDPKIWTALIKLMESLNHADYRLMAEALVEMNATKATVDIDAFGKQLETVFVNLGSVGETLMERGEIDENHINRLLMELVAVAEDNGLKIPREFALLFKQMLYFDRYVRILAPDLDIMDSNRVNMMPGGMLE